ncbi:uncharacterized protein LOC119991755 [Tripterygium wilfordii]|uniref:uncharacterized protein LOC119991755 n=1 Tax=Tripterygium wilfordii TaxID=458696 RepID=UPI0018F8567A|nr:uncharacterized protein LOC119991755 [Tripterygium wilfordii]
MQRSKKLHLLHSLLLLCFFRITCCTHATPISFCGTIPIQPPFLTPNSTFPSLLSHMIVCKSQKLFFRTSLGLCEVSDINYSSRTLTISNPPCSSSFHYISPSLLSAGLPSPPQPNSLLLFNCSNNRHVISPPITNCTNLTSFKTHEQDFKMESSCVLVPDADKIHQSFHPRDLNCTHYSRVYRRFLEEDNYTGYELGTRISFDIPDHTPEICKDCDKPNGNCGIGLRCICHPKECRDKVISIGGSINPFGNVIFSALSFITATIYFFVC